MVFSDIHKQLEKTAVLAYSFRNFLSIVLQRFPGDGWQGLSVLSLFSLTHKHHNNGSQPLPLLHSNVLPPDQGTGIGMGLLLCILLFSLYIHERFLMHIRMCYSDSGKHVAVKLTAQFQYIHLYITLTIKYANQQKPARFFLINFWQIASIADVSLGVPTRPFNLH